MDYPAGSAGRVMDSRIPSFRGEQTAAAVLEQVRQSKPRDLRQLFIVDADRRLVGTVDIQDLLIAEPTDFLKEIARMPSATVSPFDDREEVAEKLRDFHLDVLPVIDINERLIGAIRHDALLKTLEEAASVDIQMMVGAGREERALSPPQFAVKKRLPWLQINLATAFLAAAVVGLFEVHDRAIHGARGAATGGRRSIRQRGRTGARGHDARPRATGDLDAPLVSGAVQGSPCRRDQRARDLAHHRPRRAGVERQHGACARDLHRDGPVDGDRRDCGLGDPNCVDEARSRSCAVLDYHLDDGDRRRGIHVVLGNRNDARDAALANERVRALSNRHGRTGGKDESG